MKGSIGTSIIALILIVVVGYMLVTSGIAVGILEIFVPPKNCDVASAEFSCFCPEGYDKVGFFPNWNCQEGLELPNDVTIPIETWEESYKFTENQFGSTFECEGDYFVETKLSGNLPTSDGNYGYPLQSAFGICGYMIQVECMKITSVNPDGSPATGTFAYQVQFDPNDGHIYRRVCDPQVVTCSTQITWQNNPAYGC